MPRDPGEGEKTGWACALLVFVFLEQSKTRASLRVYDVRPAGRHLYKPCQRSVSAPRLRRLGRPDWNAIGMSSDFSFIKINWPAGAVCEGFILSSCKSRRVRGRGAEEVGGEET